MMIIIVNNQQSKTSTTKTKTTTTMDNNWWEREREKEYKYDESIKRHTSNGNCFQTIEMFKHHHHSWMDSIELSIGEIDEDRDTYWLNEWMNVWMNGLQPNLVDLIHIFLYVISFKKKKLAILLSNEDGKKTFRLISITMIMTMMMIIIIIMLPG